MDTRRRSHSQLLSQVTWCYSPRATWCQAMSVCSRPRICSEPGEPDRRVASGREDGAGLGRGARTGCRCPELSSWGRACRAGRPRLSWSRAAHGRSSAPWPKRSPRPQGDRVRPGHRPVHLAHDPVHGGDGAAGLRHQRPHQARLETGVLLRPGRGGRPDAGDAADDRVRLPVQGRAGDGQARKSSSSG